MNYDHRTYEYYYDFIRTQFEKTSEPRHSLMTITTIYASLCTCIAEDEYGIEAAFLNCTKAYRTFYDEYLANNDI